MNDLTDMHGSNWNKLLFRDRYFNTHLYSTCNYELGKDILLTNGHSYNCAFCCRPEVETSFMYKIKRLTDILKEIEINGEEKESMMFMSWFNKRSTEDA